MFANFRGKKGLGIQFRQTGPGHMHDLGVSDIVVALDELSKQYKVDENLTVIGHSRGGHMAALVATRFHETTSKYKVEKTIVSSGILNPVDGYYNFFLEMTYVNDYSCGLPLDFVDDDWTHGALCYRPKNQFNNSEWELIKKCEKRHFTRFLELSYPPNTPFCQITAYFNQSPYHHAEHMQGKMLILVGHDEDGSLHPQGALQFQDKLSSDIVNVVIHRYGHGGFSKLGPYMIDATTEHPEKKSIDFWLEQLDLFLN